MGVNDAGVGTQRRRGEQRVDVHTRASTSVELMAHRNRTITIVEGVTSVSYCFVM